MYSEIVIRQRVKIGTIIWFVSVAILFLSWLFQDAFGDFKIIQTIIFILSLGSVYTSVIYMGWNNFSWKTGKVLCEIQRYK